MDLSDVFHNICFFCLGAKRCAFKKLFFLPMKRKFMAMFYAYMIDTADWTSKHLFLFFKGTFN